MEEIIEWQKINKYNTLKTDHINYVFNDNLNTKWIGTNQGLYLQKKYNINNKGNFWKPTKNTVHVSYAIEPQASRVMFKIIHNVYSCMYSGSK